MLNGGGWLYLPAMRTPWSVLRCRLLGVHPWQVSDDKGFKRWDCRDFKAFVLEREYVERVHDPDATDRPVMSHGGAAGMSPSSAG